MYGIHLKTNRLESPMGIDPGKVVFSWVCADGVRQSAFQVQISGDVTFDSGKVTSSKMEYVPAVVIPSRASCRWQLILWDEADLPGAPVSAGFETGPSPLDWKALWIDPEPEEHVPAQDNQSLNKASYLRKVFRCTAGNRARLYITAHGIYDAWINGTHVDGYFLAPGSSQYDQRLQVQTYDISGFLIDGDNELLISLGDGWWRGCFGWGMRRNC